MKKKILILRSVSFQQLDKNLVALEKMFDKDQYEFHLLTHSHGIPRARSYQTISQIIDYGNRGNFSIRHVPGCLYKKKSGFWRIFKRKKVYDALVIPVTNLTGSGFLNVMLMAFRFPSASIYICNLVSEIWKVSRKKIFFQFLGTGVFYIVSFILVVPLAILFGIRLLFFLPSGFGKK